MTSMFRQHEREQVVVVTPGSLKAKSRLHIQELEQKKVNSVKPVGVNMDQTSFNQWAPSVGQDQECMSTS